MDPCRTPVAPWPCRSPLDDVEASISQNRRRCRQTIPRTSSPHAFFPYLPRVPTMPVKRELHGGRHSFGVVQLSAPPLTVRTERPGATCSFSFHTSYSLPN